VSSSGKMRLARDFDSIVEFMNEHTTGIVDNWCRDEVFAEEHCAKEKARLLINANCTKDSFFGYMSGGERIDNFNIFSGGSLDCIIHNSDFQERDDITTISSSHFACFTGNFNSEIDKNKDKIESATSCDEILANLHWLVRLVPYKLWIVHKDSQGTIYKVDNSYARENWYYPNERRIFEEYCAQIILVFYNQNDELSLCDASQNAVAACRHFKKSCNPYDVIDKLEGTISQECFLNNRERMPSFPCIGVSFRSFVEVIPPVNLLPPGIDISANKNDSRAIGNFTARELNEYIERIITSPMARYYTLLPQHEARFVNSKLVYSFKNEDGQTMMKVVKCLSEKKRCICMLPITCWRYRNCYYHQLYALPWASGKQPLYNLDLLMKDREEDKFVIITDNIEIADYMQEKCRYKNVVFTSFICQPGRHDQVDWSPLKPQITEDENRPPGQIYIACLVTNHTGKKLEQQYLEAQKLVSYLQENEELDIQDFLERPVSYTDDDTCVIEDIDDLLDKKHTGSAKPVKLLTLFEFSTMCRKAEALLQEKKLEFSSENYLANARETKDKTTNEKKKEPPPAFVFFPILMRGDFTALVGPQKSMKSFLALSIAMLATNAGGQRVKSLFHEMLWKASKPNNVGGSRGHKVLYLDFENGERTMLRRIARLKNHYWPQKNEDIEKCQSNLIIKYLDKRTNYPDSVNLTKLYDMIEEANNQGDPDHDVDLLIIDSFEGFNGNEMNFSNVRDINNFIDDMRREYKNMAVLVINHLSTQAGKGKESASRGNSAAFNNIQNEVVIQIDEALKKITTKREETSEDEKDEAIYEGRQINITYRQNREGYVIDEIMKFVGILPKAKDEAYFQVAGLEREVNLNKEEKDKLYKNNLKKLKKWLCDDMDVDKDSFESMINMTENTLRDHMK
jgi:hypothetical protein